MVKSPQFIKDLKNAQLHNQHDKPRCTIRFAISQWVRHDQHRLCKVTKLGCTAYGAVASQVMAAQAVG